MKSGKNKLFALLLAAIMLLSLAACGDTDDADNPGSPDLSDNSVTPSSEEPEESYDIIKVGSTYSITTGSMELNPPTNSLEMSASVGYLSYDALVYINPETGELDNCLAESYEWLDGTTLVIKLKEGATFSDGTALTAVDVLATMQTALDNNSAAAGGSFGFYDMENCTYSDDELTLTLKYKYEFGPALKYLSMIMVASAEFLAANPAGSDIWLDGEAVPHSGPYTKVEMVLDSYERYVLRDDYWDKDAHFDVDEFIIYKYSDSTAMFIEFEIGNLDLILDITEADYNRVMNGSVAGAEGLLVNSNDTHKIAFNLGNEYFQDINVRKALAHAIDTEAVTTAVYGSLGQQATSILASSMPYYKNVGAYEYDPDYARSLLEEGGYSNLSLNWVCVSSVQESLLAEAIQAYGMAVGIEINLDIQERASAIPALISGASDLMSHQASSPTREAYQVTTAWMSDSIFPAIRRSEDSDANQYLLTGAYSVDEAVRKEAYQNFQRVLHDEYYGIMISEYFYANAYNAEKIDTIALLSPQHHQLRYITLNK